MIIGDTVTPLSNGSVLQKTYCLIEGQLVIIHDRYEHATQELIDHSVEPIVSDVPMTYERVCEIINREMA